MIRARLAQWTLAALLTIAPIARAVDITTCSQVSEGGGKVVTFPARTSDGIDVRLKAILAMGDVRAPSPAIVMVPGSTGLYPPYCYRAVSEDFVRRGFVVLLLAPTNAVDSAGRMKMDYTFLDLVSYARSAAQWLRVSSYVDSSRIGLWGHSRGGGSVVFGASDPDSNVPQIFRYAIAAAPECSGNLPAPRIPLLIMIGTADLRVTVEACTEYARRHARAEDLEYVLLAEAGHTFWAPSDSEDEKHAAELASGAVDRFLKRFK
jgi:dienelactone hydrolase